MELMLYWHKINAVINKEFAIANLHEVSVEVYKH